MRVFIKFRQIITTFFAFSLIILSACTHSFSTTSPSPTVPVKTLNLQISPFMEQELIAEVNFFALYVEQLSGGALKIDVTEADTNVQSLGQGKYDIALFQNSDLAHTDAGFYTFSLPFLYENPNHMSIALNSSEMFEFLKKRLFPIGLFPLAALGSGSSCLVSTHGGLILPANYEDLPIALHPDNPDRILVFEALGARIFPYQDALLFPLLGQEVETKIPNSENTETVIIGAVETTLKLLLKEADTSTALYIMQTYHDLSPIWAVACHDSWEKLTAWEKAVLQEAISQMIGKWETERSILLEKQLTMLEKLGISQETIETQAMATTVYGTAGNGGSYTLPAYFDKKIYELIQF